MKNMIRYLLFILFISCLFVLKVNAECSYQERKDLLNAAKGVDIGYEIKTDVETTSGFNTYGEDVNLSNEVYSFNFNIVGLSKDLFIKYYNSFNSEEKFINYSDLKDNAYSFTDNNSTDIYTYYFEFYSSKDNCPGYKVYTTKIKKPIHNGYSDYSICKEEGLSDFKYCEKFVTEKINLSESNFLDKAKAQLDKKNTEVKEKKSFSLVNFLKKYYIYFILLVLVGVGIIILLVIRKKGSKL